MIRTYRPEDLKDILKLEQGAFPKTAYDRNIFLEWFRVMPETFLVYEDKIEQKVVAYILFWRTGHIASLAVRQDMRKKGIGSELVERVLYFSEGYARIEVRENNRGAIDFYKKNGFIQTDIVKDYYPDEDAIIMVRIDH